MDELILIECKENKIYLSEQSKFIRTFKKFYVENSIDVKPYHLKYLYNKYKKICYPNTIDEIFKYSKEIKDLGLFCRDISIKNLYNNEKEIFIHKHMIFFCDFSISYLINSNHILIDGKFMAPEGFVQTIIIMYLDPIYEKMIPGIFITINNKFKNGYIEIFEYIKQYIINFINNKKEKIKWTRYITDFEIALFSAFGETFDFVENLHHYGCFSIILKI